MVRYYQFMGVSYLVHGGPTRVPIPIRVRPNLASYTEHGESIRSSNSVIWLLRSSALNFWLNRGNIRDPRVADNASTA